MSTAGVIPHATTRRASSVGSVRGRPRSSPRADAAPKADHARANLPRRRRRVALGLLASAQFVVMLDGSIINVALPTIQNDLGLSSVAVTWVVNAYVLALGSLLLFSGRAADVFGSRRMFVAGSALFTVGTLLAAGSSTQQLLIAARVVQGVGAAALSPAAMSLLLRTFHGHARAKAMSVWGAASTLGGATGVLFGGLLVGSFGWSSVFLVTVPISAAGVVLARRVLDEAAPGPRRRIDVWGAVAIGGAVVALVNGTVAAAGHGLDSTTVAVSLSAATLLLAGFVAVERRTVDPLVPLELFKSRRLTTGLLLGLCGGATRASSFVLVALYLQQALGMAPARAGMAMVPISLAGFTVSLGLLPWILRKTGPQRSLAFGLAILAGGHLWLAYAQPSAGYAVAVLPGLILVATGVALSFTPTTMVIASAVPADRAGLASGLAGSVMHVGAALGTATFIGIAATGPASPASGSANFPAAFTASAVLALATAGVACTIAGRRD